MCVIESRNYTPCRTGLERVQQGVHGALTEKSIIASGTERTSLFKNRTNDNNIIVCCKGAIFIDLAA